MSETTKPTPMKQPALERPSRMWAMIEAWHSITRAISEAGGVLPLEELRKMTLEEFVERTASNGIRVEYRSTRRCE